MIVAAVRVRADDTSLVQFPGRTPAIKLIALICYINDTFRHVGKNKIIGNI